MHCHSIFYAEKNFPQQCTEVALGLQWLCKYMLYNGTTNGTLMIEY